jgi:SAM-dependent methyltransferase
MFTSFGYFESDEENLAVLREAARVLRPGGVFLIDFLNAGVVLSNPLGKTRREVGGYTVDEDRSVSPDGRHLVKHVAVTKPREDFDVEYDERVRLFGADELVAMADGVGLTLVRLYGDYAGAPFDAATSPRVIAACERRPTLSQGGD